MITFQYDGANRRTQMVLSNGVTASYTYDAANELTELITLAPTRPYLAI